MLAVVAHEANTSDPLSALKVADVAIPPIPRGWKRVKMTAAAINYHDVFTLKGVGTHPLTYPRILGCEGCDSLRMGRLLFSIPLCAMRTILVMRPWTLVGMFFMKPPMVHLLSMLLHHPETSFHGLTSLIQCEAVLGISWLTAYRMIFTKSGVRPGQTVLVQGSSGGISTALIQLGVAAGLRVWCSGRTPEKRELATRLGAERTFSPGETLPCQVDAVFDTSGQVTWAHSMASVRPGGPIVTCGAHGGFHVSVDLLRVFNDQITIHGVYAGTLQEFKDLIQFVIAKKISPMIGNVLPMSKAYDAMKDVCEGRTSGNTVVTM